MMRRGTLADHDVATVLRLAAAERLSGQIDIGGERPAVVYLADGELSLACWVDDDVVIAVDDESDDATYSAAILTEERRLRAATRDVLGLVLDRDDGWYHHHPLGEHRAAALWSWPVEELLAEVAVRAQRPSADPSPSASALEPPASDTADATTSPGAGTPVASNGAQAGPRPLAAPVEGRHRDGAPPGTAPTPPVAHRAPAEQIAAHRPSLPGQAPSEPRPVVPAIPTPPVEAAAAAGPAWRLSPAAPAEPLDEAAWAVVVALAAAATEAQIVERLGWPAVKAEIVLRALEARGVVVGTAPDA